MFILAGVVILVVLVIFFLEAGRQNGNYECSTCKRIKKGREGVHWSMTGIGSDSMFTCHRCLEDEKYD